jgi:hypothetical protein
MSGGCGDTGIQVLAVWIVLVLHVEVEDTMYTGKE